MGTNLLKVSLGRDLGALRGLTPSLLETLFFTILLELSIGRILGALKGLGLLYETPLETADKRFEGTNALEV